MITEDAPQVHVSMSPTVGKIAEALAKAQAEMTPAIKDREGIIPGRDGKQGYRYGYATLASCFDAVRPLYAHGIAVLQPPTPHGADGVSVATLLIHSSGEWIRGDLYMPAAKRDPQGFGSALSYARRYCLTSTVGLATEDDDGAEASRTPPAPPVKPPAKAAPNDALFRQFCDRVDHAQSANGLNAVAVGAKKAFDDRAITDSQLDIIAKAVANKRVMLNSQPHANGGA